jgi:Cu/Ag efflux pump CusA
MFESLIRFSIAQRMLVLLLAVKLLLRKSLRLT